MGDLRSVNLVIVGMVVLFVVGVLTSSSYADIDPATIVGVWLFEEGDGKVALDSSENGNDAEFQGTPTWVTGKFGKGLQFDGTSYLAVPDSDSLDINADQMSIVVWVNGEGWGGDNFIVRKMATAGTATVYWLAGDETTGRVGVNAGSMGDIRVRGATVLPLNEWIHLALVYNGEELQVYFNGILDGKIPLEGDIIQSEGEVRIAAEGPSKGSVIGIIDEVAIFASALTQGDIQEIMEVGLLQTSSIVEPLGKLPTAWAELKTAY